MTYTLRHVLDSYRQITLFALQLRFSCLIVLINVLSLVCTLRVSDVLRCLQISHIRHLHGEQLLLGVSYGEAFVLTKKSFRHLNPTQEICANTF